MHPAPDDTAAEFYHEADLRLVQAIPEQARTILDLYCNVGHLGEVVKHLQPARTVVGLCADAGEADAACQRLDRVIRADITTGATESLAALAPASFDCIVIDNAFAALRDSPSTLAALRPLLEPGGRLLAAVDNGQHWSYLDALFCGDLQAANDAAPRPTQTMGFANIIKQLLNAGFLPHLKDRRLQPPPAGWLEAAAPLAARLKLDAESLAARVATSRFFVEAIPIANLPADTNRCAPVTIGVCTNDATVLGANLLASPCLGDDRHEVLCVEGAASAAAGLNAVIENASHELIVLAHQDVYLPHWWVARLWQQYAAARAMFGDRLGVLGVYGVAGGPAGLTRFGRVADREFLLDEPVPLPARASSLDELLLVVPRRSPLRFEASLGFHLYGTDICLSAEQHGLVAAVIDAPCFHNSKQGNELPSAFDASSRILARKWGERLPIATPCRIIS